MAAGQSVGWLEEERGTSRFAGALAVCWLASLAACEPISTAKAEPVARAAESSANRAASAAAEPVAPADETSGTEPAPTVEALPAARTDGCPDGMVRVEGDYCPVVSQRCLEHHPEYRKNKGAPGVSERCLRYAADTKCLAKERVRLSFCMDRFEYPNRIGDLPRVLTTWDEARSLCGAEGKRLCTKDEFNFACEGPEMLPYATGHERNDQACNIDRPYVFPNHSRRMLTYEQCVKDARCAAELERLDQRHEIGERLSCASWAGVLDLNGNVNEWVRRPGKSAPHRGGLKGGWWGPVRDRCRPMTVFHPEPYYGYESGFRCCQDSATE